MLKHGILGLLSYKDMTGYELKEMFDNTLKHFWSAQTSQIYRELQSMEKIGWLESNVYEQKGKPDKRLYHITEAGRQEFHNWMDHGELKPRNNPMIMKTFFMAEQSPEIALRFFNYIRQKSVELLEAYDHVNEVISQKTDETGNKDRALFWSMTLEYGILQAKMDIEWCDACIKKVKKLM